ncbi:hypothetical protein ACFSTD_23320 [Novosphingobium colocasiae]
MHEIYAAEADDLAASAGFVMALATGLAGAEGMVLWLRPQRAVGQGGVAQAIGWAELGGVPDHGLIGVVRDSMALLRAAVDALRCPALGAVVVEGWGAMRELDLTASRRLALAAEKNPGCRCCCCGLTRCRCPARRKRAGRWRQLPRARCPAMLPAGRPSM